MKRRTVLIVNDDVPTRAAYTTLLAECGYDAVEAAHGGDPNLLVHRHRPDVVLMDRVMPVLDRVQTAEALRERTSPADIRVLGVTASASTAEKERMRRGCDDLLEKPCAPSEIEAREVDPTRDVA